MSRITTVQLQSQTPAPATDPFIPFYTVVRLATASIGFENYSNFITSIFAAVPPAPRSPLLADAANTAQADLIAEAGEHFCFEGTLAYDQIREATDLFLGSQASMIEDCCGSEDRRPQRGRMPANPYGFTDLDVDDINRRFAPDSITLETLRSLAARLSDPPAATAGNPRATVPPAGPPAGAPAGVPPDALTFFRQLVGNHTGMPIKDSKIGSGDWTGILRCRLRCPPLLELIWSYWQEQGMLVQGANTLTLRFQNRRPPGRDPLTRCDLSPLRPLNNILWGYVQAETDRLSVVRRAYEYDHHYGLRLQGRAVPTLAPADSRTQFIESFHRLLMEAYRYIRTSMDTTMNVDAFPVLNCLKELHLLLAEGAHNQFGDLPSTARAEMLIQQWIFARPEVRDFLGGRPGMPYPEPWMPNVETLRQMMGWADTTIRHYRDLAVFGEQLLLSVRYLPWSTQTDADLAAAWVTFWRPEIQQYLHSYRAVTSVDLSMEDVRVHNPAVLFAQPSDLIRRRRVASARAGALLSSNGGGNGSAAIGRRGIPAPAPVARLQ